MFGTNIFIIVIFSILIFQGCKPNEKSSFCSFNQMDVQKLLEEHSHNYLKKETTALKGEIIINTEIRKLDDSRIIVETYVGSLPFKGDKMPFDYQIEELSEKKYYHYYYAEGFASKPRINEEELKEKKIIVWIDKNGKWEMPFANKHFPNDYNSWKTVYCCNSKIFKQFILEFDKEDDDEMFLIECK